jgi:hypothetical protein
MLAELLLVFGVLLLVAWAFAPRGVPWANQLVRLRPGQGRQAEWMAPPEVARAVRRDYRAALAWLAECANDWGRCARELDKFAAGAYQQRQIAVLDNLARTRGPRLAARLRARHILSVRHFSADGLQCLLIDRQTERRMLTRGYWGSSQHRQQRLPDATLVWQMAYDLRQRRWKIQAFVQALPPQGATSAPLGVPVTVSAVLPAAKGRDG